jgi:hypothetical protein
VFERTTEYARARFAFVRVMPEPLAFVAFQDRLRRVVCRLDPLSWFFAMARHVAFLPAVPALVLRKTFAHFDGMSQLAAKLAFGGLQHGTPVNDVPADFAKNTIALVFRVPVL